MQMSDIALVILGVGLLSLVMLTIAYQSVLLKLARRATVHPDAFHRGVTILKPLKGVDPGLAENLEAILCQDHPNFEVIFGAEDPFDPALTVARSLAQRYPNQRIKIIGGGAPASGVNPKVRILRRMLELASHEWVLISDSNVRPGPDYLRAMQSVQIDERADLVHTVLSGEQGESLGGRLEEVQLNGWVAASICFAQRFGHPCVIGKSMLMRRQYLVDEGALVRMQDILAEDYTMGAELHRTGRKVALAPYLLPVITGAAPLQAFFNRHIRWGQMRRRIAPACFFAELTANPTPFLAVACGLLEGPAARVAGVALVAKWVLDIIAYALLSQTPTIRSAALIPVKDVLVLGMWCVSAVKRTVRWRGNLMWVGPGSRLEPVQTHSVPDLGTFSM